MKQLASFSIAVATIAVLLLLFIAPVITLAAATSGPTVSDDEEISLQQNAE